MWRLNNMLLKSQWVTTEIKEEIKKHLETNKNENTMIPNLWKWKSLSHVWLCDPKDYTVHGILQARILECVNFPFARGSFQPRDRTQVSCIASRFFTTCVTKEAQEYWSGLPIPSPADLPHSGIKLGSPALQVDFLPTNLSGKPQ